MVYATEGVLGHNATSAYWICVVWASSMHANIIGIGVQFAFRYRVVCLR